MPRPLLPHAVLAPAFAAVLGLASLPCAAAGTLVAAVPADPQHFNGAITTASHTHAVADSIFSGLVALDRQGQPQPDLASAWEISADGRRVSFKLAPHARWHDGQPVTADDVRFSFESVLLKHHARTASGLAPVIEAIETPDVHTVVFRLKRAYAPLLAQLDVTEAPILPRHIYGGDDILKHPANLKPVGSGPFRFKEHRRDDRVVLERNPDYFKPGRPLLDRLVFRVLPDARSQVAALTRGEVDFVRGVAGPEVAALERHPRLAVDRVSAGPGGGNCVMSWVFNLDRPALADVNRRRALAQAIDRQRIARDVIFGQGRVAAAPIASGIAFAHAPDALKSLTFDPAASAAALTKTRLDPDAKGVRLTLDVVHFPQFSRYAEALRQDLAAVGVTLAARPLDRAAAVDAIYMKRDFDTALVSYCQGADPEIGARRMYVSSAIGPVPFSNGAGWRNAAVDRLFDRGVTTVDAAQRGAAYREAQALIVREMPYLWLVETDFPVAWSRDFDGFAPWRGAFAESVNRR
ncbi:MAG: ABC transporter substrate-binding protein [Burkholderiaceae bacterium]